MDATLSIRARPLIDRTAEDLERPLLDNRTYRVVTLPNKLEALLIHDPDTDKVSAALDVNVGSFSDGEDMPGIAHAVEHLLFMGTKKYPVENAYNQYLTAHSGYSNAFTASTSTNYYFEVAAGTTPPSSRISSASNLPSQPKAESALYGALDRFAQFFIAPLFLEDTLDRELRAVDSEHKKNLQSDTWRLHQLNRSLSNPKHPFCHFSTGSYKTLHDDPIARGVRIRDEFIKFYETHYSANRMKLVVLGRESLDELEYWVEELFSPVPNKDLSKNRWDDIPPYSEDELGMQIFAKPVFDMRTLDIYFPYQDEEQLFETQPGRYLSHLIGHEGPGSVLAYIKAKGWANGLGAGPLPLGPGSALFSITIRLTREGLEHYKEVTKILFQYIAMLKETSPQEWIMDELKRMSEVDFRFKQKSPASRTTSSLSGTMQKPLPRKWLLSGSSLIRKFDPEGIKKAMSYLRADNFRLTIVSKDFPGYWDKKEKWYGTEYKYERIPEEFLREIEKASKNGASERPTELHLPHKNEFIPTRLEVDRKEVDTQAKSPSLIRNDGRVRVWYKKDDTFWVPKANVHISLRSPLVSLTPQTTVLAHIYRELVQDALVEYSYDAEISGLDYNISTQPTGLDLSVSGYNDKMPVLLEKVLLYLRDLEVRDDRFHIIQERLLRAFRNWDFQQPYHQVGTYCRWLALEKGWVSEQYLGELPYITADEVRAFIPQMLRQLHIEILAHGNLYKEDVLKVSDMVEHILKPRTLPTSHWPIMRALIYPQGCDFVYRRDLKDPENVNHCIEYLLYVSDNTDRALRARLLLFAQLTDEPAFDQLRTKEQLGYVVFSGATVHSMWAGYRILVQSDRSPEYLESRIESFLRDFGTKLDEMGDEKFEKQKSSLINKRLERLKNLTQETSRFWNHIISEKYDFELVEHDVAHVEQLTKSDVMEFYEKHISPSSPVRSKLAVHLLARSSPSALTDEKEYRTQAHSMVSQILMAHSVPIKSSLQTRLNSVTPEGGESSILQAAGAYLLEDLDLAEEKAKAILEQGKTAMAELKFGSTLPTKQVNGDAVPNGERKSTVIEEVHAWKAGLGVSKGAKPVRDLSEFEELGAKL